MTIALTIIIAILALYSVWTTWIVFELWATCERLYGRPLTVDDIWRIRREGK